jgi:hypothetical protein
VDFCTTLRKNEVGLGGRYTPHPHRCTPIQPASRQRRSFSPAGTKDEAENLADGVALGEA